MTPEEVAIVKNTPLRFKIRLSNQQVLTLIAVVEFMEVK